MCRVQEAEANGEGQRINNRTSHGGQNPDQMSDIHSIETRMLRNVAAEKQLINHNNIKFLTQAFQVQAIEDGEDIERYLIDNPAGQFLIQEMQVINQPTTHKGS